MSNPLHIAARIAQENMHATYGPAHVLRALLHKDLPVLKFLESKGADVYYLEEWADIRIEEYPRATRPDGDPGPDRTMATVMEEAGKVQERLGLDTTEPHCLLIAIATPGVGFGYDQMKTFPLQHTELMEWYKIGGKAAKQAGGAAQSNSSTPAGRISRGESALEKYCIDKIAEAQSSSAPPIIGRDKEIRQICEIISRRSKSNVIITGDAGVGKTALLDGFAAAVAKDAVPQHLRGASIYQLDNGALVAGASYKGEIEDRLRKITQELAGLGKPILFIDEINGLMDKQNPNGGAASILKAELAKGLLTVIGTATTDEYRKSIEKDETFSRRFEVVKVSEPDAAIAEKMLRNQAPVLESHHAMKISDDVFADTIRLARRYIKDRRLPDSALDLLDRTLAVSRMAADTSAGDVEALMSRLDAHGESDREGHLSWLYYEAQGTLSPVLLARYNEEREFKKLQGAEALHNHIHAMLTSLAGVAAEPREAIDATDLSAVVANITGIPIGKIQTKEQQKLIQMEDHLRKRVIGQDHALKTVSDAILESRSGLNKAGQPIASFFFLGPTGTGKTELAKSLAEFLFQDENSIIRFDMSEFKEEHSAALLYGAPPGYVGYEEGGMLVNKIRQQPYAIVLFDEIEKAHPSVFDIFLQILDEGKMHDRLGKEGDFSNAVILFTSNIGAENIIQSFGEGIVPKSEDLLEIMTRYFRPEFLARVTEIVPFAPISKENVTRIFNIHLQPLLKQLELQGITMKLSDRAVEHLANLGFTPKYGVRPLKGAIRTALRKPLSRMIVSGQLPQGSKVVVDVDEAGQLTWDISGEGTSLKPHVPAEESAAGILPG